MSESEGSATGERRDGGTTEAHRDAGASGGHRDAGATRDRQDGGSRDVGLLARAVKTLARIDRQVAAVRDDDMRRRAALAGAVVAGLGLAWVHWIGLVVGGALVGLTRRTLPRAIVWGLAFGTLSVAVTVLATPTMGPGEFLGLSRVALVTLAVALVAPAWGALLRATV